MNKSISPEELSEETSIDELLTALHVDNDHTRNKAAHLLRRKGDEALEKPLAYLADDDRVIRSSAAWTLGVIGLRSAIDALTSAAADPDEGVRANVVWALGELGDSRGLGMLIRMLESDSVVDVRQGAAIALGNLHDAVAVDTLCKVLREEQAWLVRESAAHSLGKIGDKRAITTLEDALTDEESRVRKAVAAALRTLEEK